jgi:Ca-activated chloride channel family protein
MMRLFLQALALTVLFSAPAFGQGIIIPDDCHRCPPRPPIPRPQPLPRVLKVKSISITTKIDTQVATTRVEQVFENDTPYRLEGTFLFPIPETASITGFALYDGDKRMAAEVVERAKARKTYEEIVRRMIDPGLLEYAGKDLFQANIFPIEPRSTRKIDLTYTQVLKNEGGTVSYRYDLGTGRRLMAQPVREIAASVEINSNLDLKNIYSPSHKISVSRDGDRRARLSFEEKGQEAQKDFQLYYSLSEKDFGLSLLTNREPGKDGYFLMLISPKTSINEQDRLAKDVIFVFDTSGSMSGEKIDKARAALRFGVESLSERDRFNIISFSGEEHLMKSELVEASREAKQQARDFIYRLQAEGGTNINDALVAALRQFKESARPSMIVFLTDGLPTVGTTDVNQINKNVTDANRASVRIFSFGVGYDVNTTLLDKISADNRGATDYVEPNEDLEVKVSNFFSKVNYPVLSDLKLDLGGVEADLIYPRNLPDLFKGSQLALVGRYKNSINVTTVRLTGKVGGRERSFAYSGQSFPSEKTDNQFLPRLWATRRVGYLLEQIRLNGENRELVDEIVKLGTRFGIVTPYTSFLVTDDLKELVRARREPAARFLGGLSDRATAPSGESAVVQSRAENELKQSNSIPVFDQYLTGVRAVRGKTFMLKDGVWIDTEYSETDSRPKVMLRFASEEFFSVLSREPDLGQYFALGQKVIVVFKGKIYQIT